MLKLPQQKRTSLTIPLTVLTGAIVGSAAALLFTRKNGADFRAGIRSTAKELRNKFGNMVTGTENKELAGTGSSIQDKVTMHPVVTNDLKEEGTSKAAAMVSHLKQSKQGDSQFPNPL